MGAQTISTSETKIGALSLQSSSFGVTIPVCYGKCKVAGNLLWYANFTSVPTTTSSGGKGGGVRQTNTTYAYEADVIMGICQGPITSVTSIWKGKSQYTNGYSPAQIASATETYTPPGSGAMTYTVAHGSTFLSMVGVTYVDAYGTTVTLAQGTQYTVSGTGVVTILDGTLRGKALSVTYQYGTGTPSSSALSSLGLSLFVGTIGQAAWSGVASAGAANIGYSGLAYVAATGYSLGSGAQVENHNFEVVAQFAYGVNANTPDADPTQVLFDVLTNYRYGAAFPQAMIGDWSLWQSFCRANNILVSPCLDSQVSGLDIVDSMCQLTNAGAVWSGSKLKIIPYADVAATGNGVTFTPVTTPVYDLTDDNYIVSAGKAPVGYSDKRPADRYNNVRLEYLDRTNQYSVAIAEATDDADIAEFGFRPMDIVQAHWICDGGIARTVAQQIMQRSLYVTKEYTVTLPWHFALLEPMDLCTLTDTVLGMNKSVVRVTKISESADGELQITFENSDAVASAALYDTQLPGGYQADYTAPPGGVANPVFFEAPVALTTTGLEVYVAAAGVNAAWGGAHVWVSLDGTNYKQVGTLSGPSRYGVLKAPLTTVASVQNMHGTLASGSAADSAALSTLCYIGGSSQEYLAYQTATLTGTGAYDLSGLTRGGYSTNGSAAHAANDPFVRVDSAIAKSGPLDLSMIGKTLYFKFTSFNIYGAAEQALSDVSPFTYTVSGYMVKLQPQAPASFTAASEPYGVRLACSVSPDPLVVRYEYRTGATWSTATVLEPSGGTSYFWKTQNAGSYTVWVACVDRFGNYSQPVSTTAVVTTGSVINLTATLSGAQLLLSWQGNPGAFAITGYEVRYGSSWAAGTSVGFYKEAAYKETVLWSGTRTYWVSAIDSNGTYGTAVSINKTVNAPSGVTGGYTTVVDNNVLIYWSAPSINSTQLPIAAYEVRKGSSWASGTLVGSNGNSTFAGVFEQVSGVFTYWIAAIDTAGTYGTPVSVTATVNQPPDFVFRNSYDSPLTGGTLVNMYTELGRVIGPRDTSETWATHYTNHSWLTPQDQITAGYPIYAEPGGTTGSYEEVIDYGTSVPTTVATATLGTTAIAGTVTTACTLSWKLNSTDAWTVLPAGYSQPIPQNFRYLRVHFDFSCAAGTNLIAITSLNVRLAIKLRNDSGSATSAIGGTSINFGYPFIYADTPVAQANGLDSFSKPYTCAVIYTGVANPTGFSVRVFDSSGTEKSGVTFSWTARGY